MHELIGARGFLIQTLGQDGTLAAIVGDRIYKDEAPEADPHTGVSPVYPLVVFQLQGATDVTGAGPDGRLMTRPLYLVRVIHTDETTAADLATAAGRVDTLLTVDTPVTITAAGAEYQILSSARERPFDNSEHYQGQRFDALGGYYRIEVQSA